MSGTIVSRAWQTVKPHVPLIKFRKGGLPANDPRLSGDHAAPARGGGGGSQAAPGGGARAAPGSAPHPQVAARTSQQAVIEDYQLPLKYRRRPLSEEEIAYINRGGPA